MYVLIELKYYYLMFNILSIDENAQCALGHRLRVLGILLFICQETDVAAHVERPGLRGLHRPSNPFRLSPAVHA